MFFVPALFLYILQVDPNLKRSVADTFPLVEINQLYFIYEKVLDSMYVHNSEIRYL